MENLSVIYYSSNREQPDFEKRIQETLLQNCGGLPIVSVSQKPIDLGKNICVGEVGASGFNCFRQIQIACQAAKTKFVISAEADCLYPKDYFAFIPPRDDICYRNTNLYVMPDARDYYFYKGGNGATHSQIVGREFYLERLNKLFEGAPEWSLEENNFPKERHRKSDIFEEFELYETENPVIQFKTHRGLRFFTSSERIPIYKLPYWGEGKRLRRKYVDGKE